MENDKAYLKDVVDSMRLAVAYMGPLTAREFGKWTEKADSVVRRLEIVGEATKRLSMPLRDAHPEIPWRRMAGMRDLLIHVYDDVELDVVYDAVTRVIPPLIPLIESILLTLPDPD